MENFVFQSPTKIIFGKGVETEVGQEVKKYANRVLLHYGGGSIKKYGLYQKVIKSLKDAHVDVVELSGVKPNPRLSLVKQGIKICKEQDIEFILAVGGGSVIDSAKAISAGVFYDGDVWDFYTGKSQVTQALPVGVVLTIPAAGSEASKGSVITNQDGGYKRSVNCDLLRPKFAIMNPELTFTLPKHQTIYGISDIMAHIMERYFTNVESVDLTDKLCEATLRAVINNAQSVLKNPRDYNARAEIMWASTIAHNDLLSTGRVGDWASHAMQHELGGIYDVAHGAGLSVVFPAWMKYVYRNNLNRFAQFAVKVWGVEPDFNDLEKVSLMGIKRTEEFFDKIGLPTRLKDLGIGEDRLEEMAEKCTQAGPIGNFKKLYKQDVINIYKLAL
ncbi:MAG: iron-containing alcohol dehydrogenase [Clostridia bacterium]|nr:iron-containing alcohol dehydrogenase [Clostridia bacterium]